MAPEQQSPYWDRIVGNNWPEIPPTAWSALAGVARDGAAALDVLDAPRALRDFDNVVIESKGLRPVRDAMAVLQHNPQAFADALNAAADTFAIFADLVRRTRNQILDVVGDATTRIDNETRGDNNGDGETDDEAEAATDAATRERILNEARAEVSDIVSAAVSSLGPQGLPELDDIARALGQPGPWDTGGSLPDVPTRTPPGQGGHHPGGRGPGQSLPFPPGLGPSTPVPDPRLPQIPLFDDPISDPAPIFDGDRPAEPDHPTESPTETDRPEATPPVTTGPGSVDHPGDQQSPTDAAGAGPIRPPASTTGANTPDAPNTSNASDTPNTSDTTAEKPSSEKPSSSPETDGAEERREHPAEPGKEADEGRPVRSSTDRPISTSPDKAISVAPESAYTTAAPAVVPPIANTTSTGTPPPSTTAPPASSSTSATSTPARPTAPPTEAPRIQHTGGGVGPTSGATAAPAGRTPPPLREPVPVRRPEEGGPPDSGKELVRDAVGAAMRSSAAPAFVVGERVDGDLVLARTLLGGIRAAVGSWLIGVEWAVSVMRHPSGVSAFVTSNEGRGWLPAGLYLPREVSTPWLWSVSEGSDWEGVADPARVLAEFAFAWGARSGAKLSAVASSQPIDPGLRSQLGDIPMAGSVPASNEMDLARPTGSTLDRLGIVGSAPLLDRAAKVPDSAIEQRCLEFAVDAHMRLAEAGLAQVESMGAPDIRLRIMRALRRGRDFPDSWWEELQDADDLLAASVLSHRVDVGRIPLGELRSDRSAGRSETGTALLCGLSLHRRCNELVLLMEGERTRQTLRDAVFTHAQVVSHPLLTTPPPTDSGAGRNPGRSAISAGGPR